jgi:hypothetical protein
MEGHRANFARGFALLLDAGLAQARGRRSEVVEHLERAVAVFDLADMQLYREVARYCLGHLHPTAKGGEQLAVAEAWMRAHGVVDPRKVAASVAPGVLR